MLSAYLLLQFLSSVLVMFVSNKEGITATDKNKTNLWPVCLKSMAGESL